jgi:hypothetical protein
LTGTKKRAVMDEVKMILRYLRQFPTKKQLRAWRRKRGINKDARLAKLQVWAKKAEKLAEHIESALCRYKKRGFLPRGVSAIRYTSKLLHLRYPNIIEDKPERLRRRIGW